MSSRSLTFCANRCINKQILKISDPSDACGVTVERDRGLADLDTVPCRDTSRYAFPGAVQEANMFSTFAQQAATRICEKAEEDAGTEAGLGIAKAATRTPKTPRFWSALSVQTQLVLDAVMASAEAGGTEVPVAISVDSGNKIL